MLRTLLLRDHISVRHKAELLWMSRKAYPCLKRIRRFKVVSTVILEKTQLLRSYSNRQNAIG